MKKISIIPIFLIVLIPSLRVEWRYCVHCLVQEYLFSYFFVELDSLSEHEYDEFQTAEEFAKKCEGHTHEFDSLTISHGGLSIYRSDIANSFSTVASEHTLKCQ